MLVYQRVYHPPWSPTGSLAVLLAFALDRCQLQVDLTRAHQDMILRRVGILADWMARSHTFSHSTGGAANRLGSLLMECVVVGLQKLVLGEEVCLHLVVPYARKTEQEDFLICPRGFDFFLRKSVGNLWGIGSIFWALEGRSQDFLIFVPALFGEHLEDSHCSHGPGCACNFLRSQLLEHFPNRVLDLHRCNLFRFFNHKKWRIRTVKLTSMAISGT